MMVAANGMQDVCYGGQNLRKGPDAEQVGTAPGRVEEIVCDFLPKLPLILAGTNGSFPLCPGSAEAGTWTRR